MPPPAPDGADADGAPDGAGGVGVAVWSVVAGGTGGALSGAVGGTSFTRFGFSVAGAEAAAAGKSVPASTRGRCTLSAFSASVSAGRFPPRRGDRRVPIIERRGDKCVCPLNARKVVSCLG